MRKLYFLIILLLASSAVSAQQDPMYSQYMFNGLSINPAYAGSRDAMSVMALGRVQWVGISGAPITQTFSFQAPSRDRRHGFGVSLINDRISYLGQTWFNASYAYRIKLDNKGTYLSLGLQGTIFNYRVNWEKADLIDPTDPTPASFGQNMWLPNAGTGLFLFGTKGYLGVSVPHLLVNSINQRNPGITLSGLDAQNAVMRRHVFGTAGYVFDLNPETKFKPSVLVKYVYGAPVEVDANVNFYFNRKLGVGASYRTGDGIVALLDYQFSPQLRAGYAYDYPFTQLRGFTSGSHELMIAYEFRYGNASIVSPRVF